MEKVQEKQMKQYLLEHVNNSKQCPLSAMVPNSEGNYYKAIMFLVIKCSLQLTTFKICSNATLHFQIIIIDNCILCNYTPQENLYKL